MENKSVNLKPGDVFLTRGNSFLAKAIRFFSRSIGEKRTQVNHVGIVVKQGTLESCFVVEALTMVRYHRLWKQYGPPSTSSVAIYRPVNLTEEELNIIVDEALEQVNKRYGYFKILAHLLDWFLLGAYVFRRFFKNNKYPICSWLVAHAYSKAGKHFGVDPGAAQPDDIWDFIHDNQDKYVVIHPLRSIWQTE